MTKDELIAELAKHNEVVPTDAPDTFLKHAASNNNLHAYFRPIAADLVLMTWLRNYSNTQARTTGPRILDFVQAAQDQLAGRVTTKLGGFASDSPQFDHVVALGPGVSSSAPLKDARYLIPAVVECGEINGCELAGDEDIGELRARRLHLSVGDGMREIVPAVNVRHRFDNGMKSKQKFLGVSRQKDVEGYLGKLPNLGGVVEMENYERVGCVFLGKAGQDTIEVTLERNTRTVPLERSLKFLDVLLHKGVEAARQEL